jgi:hypothetical protein
MSSLATYSIEIVGDRTFIASWYYSCTSVDVIPNWDM